MPSAASCRCSRRIPLTTSRDQRFYIGAKTTWDGRAGDISGNLTLAGGTERLQASLFASVNRGNEIRNKGTVKTTDVTRTAANPQDVHSQQLLGKVVFAATPGNIWRVAAEVHDTRVDTEWFSDMGLTRLGPFTYDTLDSRRSTRRPACVCRSITRWSTGPASISCRGVSTVSVTTRHRSSTGSV